MYLVFHSTGLEQEKSGISYRSHTAHVVHYVYLPIYKVCRFIFFSDMKNVDGSTKGLDCLCDLLAKVNTSQYCNQITYLWWNKVTNLIFSHTEKKQKVHQEIA